MTQNILARHPRRTTQKHRYPDKDQRTWLILLLGWSGSDMSRTYDTRDYAVTLEVVQGPQRARMCGKVADVS